MPRVFISRALKADSVFYKILTSHDYEVHGESLIEFSLIPFKKIPAADWIFFYSQNGVKYFFRQLSLEQMKRIGVNYKLATIGPATADFLEENFGHPNFVGNGNAEDAATAFLKMASRQKVLFPRARDSRRSVQLLLQPLIQTIDLVVYDNVPKTGLQLPDYDILVFTSPLNARAYFLNRRWQPEQTIVAIGKPTASALSDLGVLKVSMAKTPSESGLAEAVLS